MPFRSTHTKALSVLLSLVISLSSCSLKREEPVVHLIPEGFKGEVVIFYDQPGGSARRYEEKYRVYNIPGCGVLVTQFDLNKRNMVNDKFYFVSKDGKRREIPQEGANEMGHKGPSVIFGVSGRYIKDPEQDSNNEQDTDQENGVIYTTLMIDPGTGEFKNTYQVHDIPKLVDSLGISSHKHN